MFNPQRALLGATVGAKDGFLHVGISILLRTQTAGAVDFVEWLTFDVIRSDCKHQVIANSLQVHCLEETWASKARSPELIFVWKRL